MNISPTLHIDSNADESRIVAAGDWRLVNFHVAAKSVLPALPNIVELDGSAVSSLDPSGAYCLLQQLVAQGAVSNSIQFIGFQPSQQAILGLVQQHVTTVLQSDTPKRHWVSTIGLIAHRWVEQIGNTLNLIGRLGTECADLIVSPRNFRHKEFTTQLGAIFVDAIVLVMVVLFLLGVVFAYLLGRQALQYGANLYVVDGTSLSICRELSPVLVAILIAGRSGSAITAQLGTMKFDEEIDAIRVLGLSPYQVLIIPRMLAIVIAMPLLVFLGDLTGLGGSMLVAGQQLNITPVEFINRLVSALDTSTVVIGLSKAPVFAIFIGLIACQAGLQVKRDARSIGLSTTTTVVNSTVAVIVLNALIAVTLVKLGI